MCVSKLIVSQKKKKVDNYACNLFMSNYDLL